MTLNDGSSYDIIACLLRFVVCAGDLIIELRLIVMRRKEYPPRSTGEALLVVLPSSIYVYEGNKEHEEMRMFRTSCWGAMWRVFFIVAYIN